MSFTLTTQEQDTFAAHLRALEVRQHAVQDAVEAYNTTLADVATFVAAVAARLRLEFNARSEWWQTSTRGATAHAFIAEWEAFVGPYEADSDLAYSDIANFLATGRGGVSPS